jgi:hypothetical protein
MIPFLFIEAPASQSSKATEALVPLSFYLQHKKKAERNGPTSFGRSCFCPTERQHSCSSSCYEPPAGSILHSLVRPPWLGVPFEHLAWRQKGLRQMLATTMCTA